MAPRLGEPGQVLEHETFRGDTVRITADDRGIFWPAGLEQLALCDRAGLPVIHDDELPALLAAPVVASPDAAPDARTVPELRARATELGIEVPPGVRKRDELLALVQAAEAALTPSTDDSTTDDAGDDAGEED